MRQVEVFFDYACPYCLRGHEILKELKPLYPQIKIVWRPCESHPRPERYGVHSDLCIRGMFFAQDAGADMWAYHEKMYAAIFKEHINVENIYELAGCVKELLDAEAYAQALRSGEYAQELADANAYAYEQSGVWVVPAYRMGVRKLDSAEDIGVSKKQLKAFMDAAGEA